MLHSKDTQNRERDNKWVKYNGECVSVCVTSPSVLQPDKQEDGTVTGKDRWRQKLLSAMAAGIPVTPSSLVPSPFSSSSSCFLFPFLFILLFPLTFPSSAGHSLSVLLFLFHPLAATVSTQVLVFRNCSYFPFSSVNIFTINQAKVIFSVILAGLKA